MGNKIDLFASAKTHSSA